MYEIIQGDCLEVIKAFESQKFSAIVTDPPYGISFMGKGWDHEVPGKEYWKECFRVIKPGGHLLAMGGTRVFHRLACAIEDGGFEIRDCLMWLYGSGFPKSHNHFGIDGYGTALKPAYEPIIMAMKPLDGTFKQNAEKWGVAGINIDGCRIGSDGATKRSSQAEYPKNDDGKEDRSQHWARTGHSIQEVPKGRWPANVILDDEAGRMLDEQSGVLHTIGGKNRKFNSGSVYDHGFKSTDEYYPASSGGASRFFYCAKASSRERNEGLDGLENKFLATMNDGIGKREHNENHPKAWVKNNHPTVKPLALMEYLIKLISPTQNALILDPFAGSGTTILAARRLGISAIGIEKQPEYVEIARARINAYQPKEPDPDLFDDPLQNISSNA